MWYTLSSGIVGPTFFDDTMIAVISMSSKKNQFCFSKEWMPIFQKYIFKLDKAWPHTENAELDVLNENSDN